MPTLSRADSVTAGAATQVEADAIRRITWRLIPFLMLCYFVASLDRVNLSFASLQMNQDLHLSASVYGLGAGLFFITYCLAEVPSNLMLHAFGARRWIARIMFSWGVCSGAMAFIHGATGFYLVRLLFGAAEAGFYPGVIFFLTLWFPAAYRGRAIGVFFAAIPLSGIIGSPLSGFLLGLDGTAGLRGWQWVFIAEALPAILLAPVVLSYLRDGPQAAPWLPPAERDWLVGRLAADHAATPPAARASAVQALTNPWVLLLAALYFTNVCLLNSITFFLPQIVHGFGLSGQQTGFVVAIPSLLALVAVIWWGRRSDATGERFGHAALANFVGGAALLLSVLVHDQVVRVAALSVAFAGTLAIVAPLWAIPASFLSGRAAASGIAAISALGVAGGFVSPFVIGYLKDATGDFRYGMGGFAILAMTVAALFYAIGRRRPHSKPS